MCELTLEAAGIEREPRTPEEWMIRIMGQFNAIDAMIQDSKDLMRKWHDSESRKSINDTGAPA